ncbi:hypothetical protein TNCV_3909851 [Trichonephila clavipes]|nr:hypothetical protein TNCV_3909851 [Trichonephila clavipes]
MKKKGTKNQKWSVGKENECSFLPFFALQPPADPIARMMVGGNNRKAGAAAVLTRGSEAFYIRIMPQDQWCLKPEFAGGPNSPRYATVQDCAIQCQSIQWALGAGAQGPGA